MYLSSGGSRSYRPIRQIQSCFRKNEWRLDWFIHRQDRTRSRFLMCLINIPSFSWWFIWSFSCSSATLPFLLQYFLFVINFCLLNIFVLRELPDTGKFWLVFSGRIIWCLSDMTHLTKLFLFELFWFRGLSIFFLALALVLLQFEPGQHPFTERVSSGKNDTLSELNVKGKKKTKQKQ